MSAMHPRRVEIDDAVAQAAWVRRLALALVRDAHQADDVAQEAWLAFLRKQPDSSSSLVGWFRGVIRNLVRTRSREVRGQSFHEIEAAPAELRDEDDPARALERLETQESLLRAVRELAEPYRTVVLLRWFEGLEPAEVARRTGAPLRTVHTRTSRALAMLRERLDRASHGDRTSWMSAWMPLLAKSSATSIPVLAMNVKLNVAIAGLLLVALSVGVWLAMPEQETSAMTASSAPAPLAMVEDETRVAGLRHGEITTERVPISTIGSEATPVEAAATLLVRVRDDVGSLQRFAVRLIEPEHAERLRGLERAQEDRPTGEATVTVDRSTFVVQVYADMHVPRIFGPFEKVVGETELEVALERLPGIRGRVVYNGRPVEGALVSLHEAIPLGRRAWDHGLLVRSTDGVTSTTESQLDGSFALTLLNRGRFWVRARHDGFVAAEIGPLDLDPKEGRDGLLLELTRGGSIEGDVLLPAGGSLAAEVVPLFDPRTMQYLDAPGETVPFHVVATRGDGFHRIVRPDERGHFRFDGLMPGPWFVLRMPAGAVPGIHWDDGPGETPVGSNCEVIEGAVTHFDLDLRRGAGARLAVQVRLADTSLERWKFRVAPTAWRGNQLDKDVHLLPDGTLSVETLVGPAVLHVVGRFRLGDLHLREQMVLTPGDNTWSLDLPVGSIEGRIRDLEQLGDKKTVYLRWESAGRDAVCTVHVPEDGVFHIDNLPAGTWQATNANAPTLPASSFGVRAGGTAHVELSW